MSLPQLLDEARDFVADTPRHLRSLTRFLRERVSDLPSYFVSALVAVFLIGVALWAFVEIVESFTSEATLFQFDAFVKDTAERIATPGLVRAMVYVTNLAAPILVVVVTLGLATFFAIKDMWDYLLMLALALGAGEIMLYAMKLAFNRARPVTGSEYDSFGASFPSGHAFTALVLYGLLAYLVWRMTDERWARVSAIVFAVGATLGVGFSRLYLGVHWLTDVLGGYAAGMSWLVFSVAIVRFREGRREHRAAAGGRSVV